MLPPLGTSTPTNRFVCQIELDKSYKMIEIKTDSLANEPATIPRRCCKIFFLVFEILFVLAVYVTCYLHVDSEYIY
jgi:hypothetical protein